MDVAVLADISQSMKPNDREELADIFVAIVDKLRVSSSGSHVAVITFGPSATVINTFADSEYYDAGTLKERASYEILHDPGKDGTRTDLAEDLAVNEVFTEKGGDRTNVANVMLVFTDGKFWINKTWDKEPEIPLSQSTKALKVTQLISIVLRQYNQLHKLVGSR